MRNRAKCKLCNEILESFHVHDYVTCKCGEISIDGGLQYAKSSARNYRNFIRIDDDGREVPVKFIEDPTKISEQISEKDPPALTRQEKIDMLQAKIDYDQNLPLEGLHSVATTADLCAYMMIILSILKDENK